MRYRHTLTILALTAVHWLLPGCMQIGPKAIEHGRLSYNEAIQRTEDRELLLNIVRMRYRDTPSFLRIANIAVQFNLAVGAEGRANIVPSRADNFNIYVDGDYYERPTISYRPVDGQAFVQQMLEPISENNLVLLYNAGWPVDTLFSLTVQSINSIDNAPGASGSIPEVQEPDFVRFQGIINDLRILQRSGGLSIGHTGGKGSQVQIRLNSREQNPKVLQRLYKVLDLKPDQESYFFGQALDPVRKTSIAVVNRSLMNTLFYLSQGVDAPDQDLANGRVAVTQFADGSALNWQKATRGLFRVHSQSSKPRNAYVTIYYRDSWFYIDDADMQSKTTFSLLSQLFAMQAGSLKNAGPILTLPIGGGD